MQVESNGEAILGWVCLCGRPNRYRASLGAVFCVCGRRPMRVIVVDRLPLIADCADEAKPATGATE